MTDLDGPATASAFLRVVGISRQRLTALRQEGVIKGTTLGEWIRSYCDNLRRQAGGRVVDDAMRDAKLRKAIAMAELAELKAALERGAVIRLADATASFTTIVRAARDRFRAIPWRVAGELASMGDERAICERLGEVIDETLHDLADGGKRVGKGYGDDGVDDEGGGGPGAR